MIIDIGFSFPSLSYNSTNPNGFQFIRSLALRLTGLQEQVLYFDVLKLASLLTFFSNSNVKIQDPTVPVVEFMATARYLPA